MSEQAKQTVAGVSRSITVRARRTDAAHEAMIAAHALMNEAKTLGDGVGEVAEIIKVLVDAGTCLERGADHLREQCLQLRDATTLLSAHRPTPPETPDG